MNESNPMKLILRLLFGFLAAATLAVAGPLSASASIERVVERSFTVEGAGTLTARTGGGSIEVMPGSGRTVRVFAREHIRAASEAEADERLRHLTLTLDQHGNDVAAVAEYERSPLGLHLGSWPPVEVDFVITVPTHYSADLKTAGGGIQLGDLTGRFALRTAGGTLRIGRIEGDLEGATAGGNIVLASGRGRIELSTSGGSVTADQIAGSAHLRTGGGKIEVGTMAGPIAARTGGGSIRVVFAGPMAADSSLATGGGGIRVRLPAGATVRLDAATAGGEIETDGVSIALTRGGRHADRLLGTVNGGGPALSLRSGGGDISIAGS